MHRTDIPDDTGMLFVFAPPQQPCFYMANTPTALSIAFARPDGRIVKIADMAPNDAQTLHCPPEPILHALEVPQGYFNRRNVQVGDTLIRPQLRLPLLFAHASSDRD